MRFQVLVRLKEGVLDVQGKAVESGLQDKKFSTIKIKFCDTKSKIFENSLIFCSTQKIFSVNE